MSKIEWTGQTWNPLVGCTKISEGCKNCYAINMANRLMHMPATKERYAGIVMKTAGGKLNWSGKINLNEEALSKPLIQKKPTTYFVNSMSDLFHEDVPFRFVDKVFAVMAVTPHHTYQVLTKRPDRMLKYFRGSSRASLMTEIESLGDEHPALLSICSQIAGRIPTMQQLVFPNIWLGTSVENQKTADERIPALALVPAAVRFLSCEPLLGPVDISSYLPQWGGRPLYIYDDGTEAEPIDWVIAGGESGHGARPVHPEWVRNLRDQCAATDVPFFFKQWGEWRVYDHDAGDNKRSLGQFYGNEFMYGNYVHRHGMGDVCMAKVGKKTSGRTLDGLTHDAVPLRNA